MDRNALIFTIGAFLSSVVLLTSDHDFVGGLAVAVFAFAVLWGVSLVLKNAGIVDIFWGPGFVLLGAFYALTVPGGPTFRGVGGHRAGDRVGPPARAPHRFAERRRR